MSESSDRDRAWGKVELNPETGFTPEDARALREGTRNRMASALALHAVYDASGELARHTLLEYRCGAARRGCLLLRLFEVPVADEIVPAVYYPPFKLSRERNAFSHPKARATRTSDGERHWNERADLFVEPMVGYNPDHQLACDHVYQLISAQRVMDDLESRRRGEVIIVTPTEPPTVV